MCHFKKRIRLCVALGGFAFWTSHKLASLNSDKMAADQLSFQLETTPVSHAIGQQWLEGEAGF